MDMKWLIASDIHGSALYCGELIKAFGREGADRLLLLGDLLYHGPRNDLPKGYAPKEVIAQLSGLKDKIFCVRGNCEAQVDQMVLPFPVMAEYCLIETADRLVFATHGHVYNTDNPPALFEGDVLLHGHTQIPPAGGDLCLCRYMGVPVEQHAALFEGDVDRKSTRLNSSHA